MKKHYGPTHRPRDRPTDEHTILLRRCVKMGYQMETELDGRCLDVAEFGIAVFGEGGEEDVGSGLVPVRPAGGLDLCRVLLLTPYVSPARAGFLEVEGEIRNGSRDSRSKYAISWERNKALMRP